VTSSRLAIDVAVRLGGGGSATIVGERRTTSNSFAALANGTSSHSIELDDVTSESSLHPAVAAFPAVLAVAETVGATPQQFIEATVAAYEVILRLGNALDPASAYSLGFHPTGTCGVFGATVGAGKLLGLDGDGLATAMGIAGSMASGSLEYLSEGAWTKRLNAGWAAHGGVVAAELARAGFTGPRTIIEGRLGYLHGYSRNADPSKVLRDLRSPYAVMQTAIKPHACCRYIHGPIDCVLAAVREEDLKPEQIRRIRVAVLGGGFHLVAEPLEEKQNPTNVVDAQFSVPFGCAVAAVRRRAGLDEFSDAVIHDPLVREMMRRVEPYRDPEVDRDYPRQWRAKATVELVDGRVVERRVERPKGEPENPLTWEELSDKFLSLAGPVVGEARAREIAARTRALEQTTIADLAALLRP